MEFEKEQRGEKFKHSERHDTIRSDPLLHVRMIKRARKMRSMMRCGRDLLVHNRTRNIPKHLRERCNAAERRPAGSLAPRWPSSRGLACLPTVGTLPCCRFHERESMEERRTSDAMPHSTCAPLRDGRRTCSPSNPRSEHPVTRAQARLQKNVHSRRYRESGMAWFSRLYLAGRCTAGES